MAVATLTYIYAESTAVLGPLAVAPEPHCYDLCQKHTDALTVPGTGGGAQPTFASRSARAAIAAGAADATGRRSG